MPYSAEPIIRSGPHVFSDEAPPLALPSVGLPSVARTNLAAGTSSQPEDVKAPYDVIFVDLHMPLSDGLTVAQRLREAGLKHAHIVLMTAGMCENLVPAASCAPENNHAPFLLSLPSLTLL